MERRGGGGEQEERSRRPVIPVCECPSFLSCPPSPLLLFVIHSSSHGGAIVDRTGRGGGGGMAAKRGRNKDASLASWRWMPKFERSP